MVKKIFHILLLLFATSSLSLAKDGIFLGINAGFSVTNPTYTNFGNYVKILPKSQSGYSLGVNLGYKQYLYEGFGLNYYLDYNFSSSSSSAKDTLKNFDPLLSSINPTSNGGDIFGTTKFSSNLMLLNVDAFYDFARFFSVYAGLGLGIDVVRINYLIDTSKIDSMVRNNNQSIDNAHSLPPSSIKDTTNSFSMPINLGFNIRINPNNQIGFKFKLPLIRLNSNKLKSIGANSFSSYRTYILQIGYSYIF